MKTDREIVERDFNIAVNLRGVRPWGGWRYDVQSVSVTATRETRAAAARAVLGFLRRAAAGVTP